MKELEFLEIIKNTLTNFSHIGDDCAYLKDLGIVITQDSLVEDIHFCKDFATPYQLGYKAIMVNLSDIFASGAKPKYITISLSLPKNTDNTFVKEFYQACEDLSNEYDFEVIGGDITGSEKIFISICAIGITSNRKISSRKHAKTGDYVITTGNHGSSAAGLWLLQNEIKEYPDLINSHLMPIAQKALSNDIATNCDIEYAMMDTSDGLMDALFKIAQSSNKIISIDFDKIPYDKNIEKVSKTANKDFRDWIFWGGEDYQIISCVNKETINKLDKNLYTIIGEVKDKNNDSKHFVEINYDGKTQKITDLEKTYNHFEEN